MTYADTETSAYLHSPIELYEFNQVDVTIYRYTSSDYEVTYGGGTYLPVPIVRDYIEQNQNLTRNNIKIKMPIDVSLISQFIADPPSNIVEVTIRRFHKQDPDEEVIVLWTGRALNVDFKKDIGEILCESLITSMRRPILRRLYQVTCPHLLYQTACGVNEVTYREDATVTAIDGLDITSTTFSGQADDYFTGGLVRITIDGIPHARAIISHTGDTIEVDLQIVDLVVGDVLETVPGCDRSISICISKFDNQENFGGFPYIPEKNPMGEGAPIW